MKISRPTDRELVVAAFSQAYTENPGVWRGAVRADMNGLGLTQSEVKIAIAGIDSIHHGQSPRVDALSLLAYLEQKDDQVRGLLLRLIEHLAGSSQPELVDLAAGLRQEQASVVSVASESDAFMSFHIRGGQPFFNRTNVRKQLRQLLFTGPNPSVLVVRGPEDSGKSYTSHLIHHLRTDQGFEMVPVDLEGDLPGAAQLARTLVAGIKPDTSDQPKQGPEDNQRWVGDLAAWVVGTAVHSGRRWCFVIDGLAPKPGGSGGDKPHFDETIRLLNAIAKLVELGAANESVRLVLLEFDKTLAGLNRRSIAYDDLDDPADIRKVDLVEYLTWLRRSRGAPDDIEMVKQTVEGILTACPPTAADRLGLVQIALEAIGDTPEFFETSDAGNGQ